MVQKMGQTHLLPAASITRLDRRTRHGRIRAIDAAVAGERPKNGLAALAVIKPLTRIGRHCLGFNVTAFRACDC